MSAAPIQRAVRLVASALVLPAWLGSLAVLSAGAAAPTRAPTLTLTARAPSHSSPAIELVARLVEPAGAPGAKPASPGGMTVSFSVQVREFSGAPLLALGSATTDEHGVATFTYSPTWTGGQDLVASATNASGTTLASASTSVVAPRAAYPFAGRSEAVRPDGKIGQVVVGVLLTVVVLLWIVLVSVVVRVQRGRRRPEAPSLS